MSDIVERREALARKAVDERWPRGWARSSKLAALPMVAHAIDLADAEAAAEITRLRDALNAIVDLDTGDADEGFFLARAIARNAVTPGGLQLKISAALDG